MNFLIIAQNIGELLDLVGVFVIVTGAILSVLMVLGELFSEKHPERLYRSFRQNLGRSILLGLEFLVAGDIIRSVTGTPNFTSVGVLVVIVLVRSFLSMTFEMEVEGHWPWQRSSRRPAV
jgi:uncharacterized membrane protein